MRVILFGLVLFFTPCMAGVPLLAQPVALQASWADREQPGPREKDLRFLKKELSFVRGKTRENSGWPRTVEYDHREYRFSSDTFQVEKRTFSIQAKPVRIIPHAVGVAEILWAICPRERIVAFIEFCGDPSFCIVADEVMERGNVVRQTETERILGLRPDLVFTVSYSDATFKTKLSQAGIPLFDLGYFGTVESIKQQILLIGRIIGEEGNAEALVRLMDTKIRELQTAIPAGTRRPRILYYDRRGYVPGSRTNFQSICELIRAVNVGAEQGVKSWSQIDFETLLKWDPDIIVVPENEELENRLRENPVFHQARAVKQGRLYSIPGIYMAVNSQYMILSAYKLAGLVYPYAPEP